jgi:hypothetical protein
MNFATTLLILMFSVLAAGVLVWSLVRIRTRSLTSRHGRTSRGEGDGTTPWLSAGVVPLKYPGPIGPRSCLVIANDGELTLHDVIVTNRRLADEDDGSESAVTLWNYAEQLVADRVVLGTLRPRESALVPAVIRREAAESGVVVTCRSGVTTWQLDVELSRRRVRSQR